MIWLLVRAIAIACQSQLSNCNKFYYNITFYKLNTYLILTIAFVLAEANIDDQTRIFCKKIFLSVTVHTWECACINNQKTQVHLTLILGVIFLKNFIKKWGLVGRESESGEDKVSS